MKRWRWAAAVAWSAPRLPSRALRPSASLRSPQPSAAARLWSCRRASLRYDPCLFVLFCFVCSWWVNLAIACAHSCTWMGQWCWLGRFLCAPPPPFLSSAYSASKHQPPPQGGTGAPSGLERTDQRTARLDALRSSRARRRSRSGRQRRRRPTEPKEPQRRVRWRPPPKKEAGAVLAPPVNIPGNEAGIGSGRQPVDES